jgi:hypothetical protein
MSPALLSRVETQLRLNGAREWQIEKCANAIAESLSESEPLVLPPAEAEIEPEE